MAEMKGNKKDGREISIEVKEWRMGERTTGKDNGVCRTEGRKGSRWRGEEREALTTSEHRR